MTLAAGEIRREALRVMKRLLDSDCFLLPVDDEQFGVFSPRNKYQSPVQKVALEVVNTLHRADLLTRRPSTRASFEGVSEYRLSKVGRAWWQRHNGGADPFQAQHQLRGSIVVDEGAGGVRTYTGNLGEAPLGWLSRRKGPDGKPFLTSDEVAAGERLRRDYTFAQLSSRVTADWEGFLAHVDRSGGGEAGNISDIAMDARARVSDAIQAIGPHLSDVLIATCCYLQGLEQAEQSFGWPQRSAKIILKIALGRLATHYGMGMSGPPARRSHTWHARKDGASKAAPYD